MEEFIMIINHNLGAMNANRNMGINSANAGKSMEKLSSGLRINKAGDDAAGLAISEKMRGQIRGLDQAGANAQDGISLLQTAEGSLSETHSILQRMRELSVQSASDTATAPDRTNIQTEVDQLSKEITRISNTSEFNTKNLLAGGFDSTFQIGANAGQNLNVKVSAMDAKSLGVSGFVTTATINAAAVGITGVTADRTVGTSMGNGTTQNYTVNGTGAKTTFADTATGLTGMTISTTANSSKYNGYSIIVDNTQASGSTTTATVDATAKTIRIGLASGHAAAVTAAEVNSAFTTSGIGDLTAGAVDSSAGGTAQHAAAAATQQGLADNELEFALNGEKVIVQNDANQVKFTSASNKGITLNKNAGTTTAAAFTNKSFTVSVASSAAAITNTDGSVKNDATAAAGIDVSSQATANNAITTINTAIETVSAERSKLGAFTNRLEHTIANLGTSSENLTSAESRIRDVNMAKEMSTFSKNNILAQAAQAMLAQANQQPQQVLQLLR
jgi:flagellin